MARPQFGTTRSQMAYLLSSCGEELFRKWLNQLHEGHIRLYDGNSAVVRAVAMGEIDAGLTDSDDVAAGRREKWPVAMKLDDAGRHGCAPGFWCGWWSTSWTGRR